MSLSTDLCQTQSSVWYYLSRPVAASCLVSLSMPSSAKCLVQVSRPMAVLCQCPGQAIVSQVPANSVYANCSIVPVTTKPLSVKYQAIVSQVSGISVQAIAVKCLLLVSRPMAALGLVSVSRPLSVKCPGQLQYQPHVWCQCSGHCQSSVWY